MILGMSREDTIKRLLSPSMYEVYVMMVQSEVYLNDYIPDSNNKDEASKFKEEIKDITTIGALILNKALEYTPVKTGELRKSLFIKSEGTGIVIGYTKEYAIYVHEIGFNNHAYPTRYKYLEDAAYEIALETNTNYRISISYEPLEIYINLPNKGADLYNIKNKENKNRMEATRLKLMEDYFAYDSTTASDEEKLYYDKLDAFVNYWLDRGMDTYQIAGEWGDRHRHD